jgi:L-histidine Nalpha-methyltransferase
VTGGEASESSRMRGEVAAGLARPRKEISSKYFYDHRGSELFEEITRLPEYYPTRVERKLLADFVPAWLRSIEPAALVEFGAGAADKTRILLDGIVRARSNATFIPVDISGDFLERVATGLRIDYPSLRIRPLAADITNDIGVPRDTPRPAVFALLGGTIGNFNPDHAVRLLRRIRTQMQDQDRLVLGLDLVKPRALLEAAYNDSAGVTAEFNRNVLHVLNRELGADFEPDEFRHHAFFNEDEARIEMHLVALRPMTVTIPGTDPVRFAEGESVRTEISCKYTRPRAEAALAEAGLALDHWVAGEPGFALTVSRPALTPRTAS